MSVTWSSQQARVAAILLLADGEYVPYEQIASVAGLRGDHGTSARHLLRALRRNGVNISLGGGQPLLRREDPVRPRPYHPDGARLNALPSDWMLEDILAAAHAIKDE